MATWLAKYSNSLSLQGAWCSTALAYVQNAQHMAGFRNTAALVGVEHTAGMAHTHAHTHMHAWLVGWGWQAWNSQISMRAVQLPLPTWKRKVSLQRMQKITFIEIYTIYADFRPLLSLSSFFRFLSALSFL